MVKVKCTLVHALRLCTDRTAHRGEWRYSSTLSWSRPRRGEGSVWLPARSLPPGKTRYPLFRRLGGPHGRSGQVEKISPPPGFGPRTVQLVASRYTDYGTFENEDTTCIFHFLLVFVAIRWYLLQNAFFIKCYWLILPYLTSIWPKLTNGHERSGFWYFLTYYPSLR